MIYLLFIFVLIRQMNGNELIELRNAPNGALYNLSSISLSQSWPKLYSNQLSDQQLATYFRINRTSVELAPDTSRQALCSAVNSCFHGNQNQCLLDLNLIVYLKNENKSSFNEIKLIKLAIVLSDWSRDFIFFDQSEHHFVFDMSKKTTGDVQTLGLVKASSFLNQDLNGLVRYYVEFRPSDKLDLIDLVKINEHTGQLIVNKTKLVNHKYANYYELFVNAVIKCSQNHRALHNQTLVRLSFVDTNRDQPIINLISLVQQKSITKQIDCLKLNQNDLVNSHRIALAQLQIDNFDFNQTYVFQINQSDKFRIKIEHLIDNLFVVYLLNTNSSYLFISEVLKISFKLTNSNESIYSQFYVCVNVRSEQELHEELSLVRFRDNLVIVEAEQNSAILQVDGTLGDYNFVLDPTFDQFNYKLEKLSANSVKISMDANDDLLHHEALVLAFDSNKPLDQFLNSYSFLKQIGLEYRKFLSFSAKVIFVKENFPLVSKFNPSQKIAGYLPTVENIVPLADLLNFGNSIENYFYESNESNSCVKVNKYSGLVVSQNCSNISQISVSVKNVDSFYNLNDIVKLKIDKNEDYFKPILAQINSTLARNEFNINFNINLNRLDELNGHEIEIVRMLSVKEDTLYYTTGQQHSLLNLNPKLGSISLNLTTFYQQAPIVLLNKCFLIEVLSKSYKYLSPTRRLIKSSDLIDVNICFSVDSRQEHFLAGELATNFGFRFLRAQNITKSIAFITFISLFMTTSILLLAIIVYMYRTTKTRRQMAKQYSDSSECKLKIRNDDLYQSVEQGLVPTKLDVLLNKKPISPDSSKFIEVSSIKEVSEDQGVYCVATGTSFTSNLSSTSECIDSVSNCSVLNGQEVVLGIKKTELSLFDMTPMPNQKVFKPVDTNLNKEISDINEWLLSSKDHRLVVSSQANFSFDTQTSTISSNECII